MKFNDDIIREIRDRISIYDLISEYTNLKRVGSTIKGLCPFHSEKTPSFTVNEDKGLYYCFGCGKGGDIFTFLRDIEGFSFSEAVKHLADKAGINIEEVKSNPNSSGILDAFALAHSFYISMIRKPQAAGAVQYLNGRGIDSKAIEQYGLGYAPDEWSSFVDLATKNGFNTNILTEAGLATKTKKGNHIDFFRNGIIVPIKNRSGRVIAFGMRNLGNDGSKYINSPEHPLYKKGETLFGLSFARNQINKSNKVILTEGYFDVISLWIRGIHNVVAGCGTALTSMQAAQLNRMAEHAILLYDGDKAGIAATHKAIPIILNNGLNCKVLSLPEGEDPDSYARSHSVAEINDFIDSYVDFFDYIYSQFNQETLMDANTKKDIINTFIPYFKAFHDVGVKNLYLDMLSSRLNYPLDEIQRLVDMPDFAREETRSDTGLSKEAKEELFLISCVLHNNRLLHIMRNFNPFILYRGIFDKIKDIYEIEGSVEMNDISHFFTDGITYPFLTEQVFLHCEIADDIFQDRFIAKFLLFQIELSRKELEKSKSMYALAEKQKDKAKMDKIDADIEFYMNKMRRIQQYQKCPDQFLKDLGFGE